MFYNVPQNIVICINEMNTRTKIFPQIKNIAYYTIDCSDDWKLKQKKINNEIKNIKDLIMNEKKRNRKYVKRRRNKIL